MAKAYIAFNMSCRYILMAKMFLAGFNLAIFNTSYANYDKPCYSYYAEAITQQRSDEPSALENFIIAADCYFDSDSLDKAVLSEKKAADSYFRKGQTDKALYRITRAIRRVSEASSEPEIMGGLFTHQGYYYLRSGQIWNSAKSYEKALAIYEKSGLVSDYIVRYVYQPLSNNYDRLGDYQSALKLKKQTLEYWQAENDPFMIAVTLNNIAVSYNNQSQYENAVRAFQKALEQIIHIDDKELKCDLYEGLAAAYIKTGQLDQAIHWNKQAKDLASKVDQNSIQLKNINYNFAMIYQAKDDHVLSEYYFRQAEQWCDRSDEILPREKGKIQYYFGQWYESKGNYVKAIRKYHDAINTISGVAASTPIYGELKDDAIIEPYLFLALTAKAGVIKNYCSADREALVHGLKCVDLAQHIAGYLRVSYFQDEAKFNVLAKSKEVLGTGIDICYILNELSGTENYFQKAFNYSEQSRSNVMIDRLIYSELTKGNEGLSKAIARQKDLWQSINELKREMFAQPEKADSKELLNLERQVKLIELELEKSIPALEGKILQNRSVGAEELLKYSSIHDKVILEYFVGSKYVYAFIAEDKTSLLRIAKSQEVQDIAFNFLNSLSEPMDQRFQKIYIESAYILYTQLVEPVSKLIDGRNLIILSDGALLGIPFEAFLLEKPKENLPYKFGKLPYLLNRYVIQYEQSFLLLNKIDRSSISVPNQYLGIAPVFYRYDNLNPIANNAGLVRQISEEAGGMSLVAEKATLSNFKTHANNYSIIHLYTHAVAEDSSRMEAWIGFTDQEFYESDVMNTHLSAELFILSACETGKGQHVSGEGVLNMSRAFRMAGCKSVIQAQWSVNDDATAAIINSFFNHIRQVKTSLALQQAKKNYLADENIDNLSKHPYFWSGITMVGVDTQFATAAHPGGINLYTGIGAALIIVFLIYLIFRRNRIKSIA